MRPMPQAPSVRHFQTKALTIAILFLGGPVALCGAAEPLDGAALYQRHCANCHPEITKLKMNGSFINDLRMPPAGMPAFGPDKLSDREVRATEAYLRSGEAASLGTEAAPAAKPETQAPARSGKPAKEKKQWLKGFGTDD